MDEDVSEDEVDEPKPLLAVHEKGIEWLPWVIPPIRGTERIWIRQRDEAPEWLALLYGA